MNVVTSPTRPQTGTGAGHVLNLDGQGESDHYAVHTNGSHGNVRNYNINVLDTGAPNQGVDELAVYGFDDLDPAHNTGLRADDILLLRALTCIDNESPFAVTAVGGAAVCSAPTRHRRPPGVHRPARRQREHGRRHRHSTATARRATSRARRCSASPTTPALNGRITVYGLGGNDAFYVDDTQATMTLDGGAGNDAFQIGQIFGTQRDSDPAPDGGALLPADTFPSLVPDDARLAEPRCTRSAAGHRRHRQRPVHRLLEPGRDPAQRRRRQRPVHRPRLRDRRGLRHRRHRRRPSARWRTSP